jgi:hypothetical protein
LGTALRHVTSLSGLTGKDRQCRGIGCGLPVRSVKRMPQAGGVSTRQAGVH